MKYITAFSRFLIQHKSAFLKVFWVLVGAYLLGLAMAYALPELESSWGEFGEKSGTLAIICLGATALPGMLRRFGVKGVLQQMQVMLMSYRRQTGISMYIFAFGHYCFERLFDVLKYNVPLVPSRTFEIIGSLALFVSTPLFLTSNDASQRVLGKWWKVIHRLVYIIPWILVFHLSLSGKISNALIIITVVGLLEIISWLKVTLSQESVK